MVPRRAFTAKQAAAVHTGYLPAVALSVQLFQGSYVDSKRARVYGIHADALRGEMRELLVEGPLGILYEC